MKNRSFLILLLLGYSMLSVTGSKGTQEIERVVKVAKLENSVDCLRGEINKMITLLERNKRESSEALIRRYATREDLKEFDDEKGKFKELVDRFHKDNREKVLRGLKATIKQNPEIEEGKKYIFKAPKDVGGDGEIVFEWSEKDQRFYVRN